MNALLIIFTIILVLAALVVIVSVLLQQGRSQGLGAITGGAETFFGKNKAKSYEGKLALATKIAAGVFIVLSLVIAAMMA
jgi:preprotein translocase subunit SecG